MSLYIIKLVGLFQIKIKDVGKDRFINITQKQNHFERVCSKALRTKEHKT